MIAGLPVEEIKSRLDIVEVVGQYLKLTKAGANYKATCPFHTEKTASFFVSPAKQIWRCFGCQKGGDIFTFVQEIEGVEFGDALRILAQKAGIELKTQTYQTPELKSERQHLYEICEFAAKFFEKQLFASKTGLAAAEYLRKRGLTDESLKLWRVGYSPDSWRGLTNFLSSAGYTTSEIEKAGLCVRGSSNSVFDRFRGRIMFPIFDFYSQVIGFGGRIFGKTKGGESGNEVKYINTPSTLLYDKSRILYGLDKTKVSIKKNNACIIVEGYTDVIMSFQAGVDNVVSSSGTALTANQLKLIKRLTDNLILGYDMDLAGDTANKRGIDLALAMGFNVSVARPPYEDKDPADVILENPGVWQEAVKNTKTIMDYYFENAFRTGDISTADGKKEIVKILLPPIKKLPNAIEQAHWLQKLASKINVREEDLRQELKKVKLEQSSLNQTGTNQPNQPLAAKDRRQILEEKLIALMMKYPRLADLISDNLMMDFAPKNQAIIAMIKNGAINNTAGIDENIKMMMFCAEMESISEKEAKQEMDFYLNEIKKTSIKSRLEKTSFELLDAQKHGEEQKVNELQQEFNSLSKLINKLEF